MRRWHGVAVGGALALVLGACGGTVKLRKPDGAGGGGSSGGGSDVEAGHPGSGGSGGSGGVGGAGGVGGPGDGSGGLIGSGGIMVQAPGPNEPEMPLCQGRPDCPWSVRDPAPSHSVGQAAVAQGGAIYVIGGNSLELDLLPTPPGEFPPERAKNSSVYRYDVTSDTWEEKAPLPLGVYVLTAHALGDKIYVFNAYAPTPAERKVQIYDPATDEWSEGPPMPTERYEFSSAALDGKVYVAGGNVPSAEQPDLANPTTQLEIFDPTSGWSSASPMQKAMNSAASCALDGRVYVFGGKNNNRTSIYDVATDTWSQGTPSGVASGDHRCVTVGSSLIVIGGRTLLGDTIDVVAAYDPSRDTWQTLEPMPTPRFAFGADALEGKVYVFGGQTSKIEAGYGLLNNVEVLEVTP